METFLIKQENKLDFCGRDRKTNMEYRRGKEKENKKNCTRKLHLNNYIKCKVGTLVFRLSLSS